MKMLNPFAVVTVCIVKCDGRPRKIAFCTDRLPTLIEGRTKNVNVGKLVSELSEDDEGLTRVYLDGQPTYLVVNLRDCFYKVRFTFAVDGQGPDSRVVLRGLDEKHIWKLYRLRAFNYPIRKEESYKDKEEVLGEGKIVKVGDDVVLKKFNAKEIVAFGKLISTDPSKIVGEEILGRGFWEVHINQIGRGYVPLARPYGQFKTIGQTVGKHIAWPALHIGVCECPFSEDTEV